MLIKYIFRVEAQSNLSKEELGFMLEGLPNQRESFLESVKQYEDPVLKISSSELNVLVSEDEGLTWKNV